MISCCGALGNLIGWIDSESRAPQWNPRSFGAETGALGPYGAVVGRLSSPDAISQLTLTRTSQAVFPYSTMAACTYRGDTRTMAQQQCDSAGLLFVRGCWVACFSQPTRAHRRITARPRQRQFRKKEQTKLIPPIVNAEEATPQRSRASQCVSGHRWPWQGVPLQIFQPARSERAQRNWAHCFCGRSRASRFLPLLLLTS